MQNTRVIKISEHNDKRKEVPNEKKTALTMRCIVTKHISLAEVDRIIRQELHLYIQLQ
jgi:hypothetical protein